MCASNSDATVSERQNSPGDLGKFSLQGGNAMTTLVLARPGSVQRRSPTADPSREDIAKLAYVLWQQHGCPEESAEENWLEAERQLRENGEQAKIARAAAATSV